MAHGMLPQGHCVVTIALGLCEAPVPSLNLYGKEPVLPARRAGAGRGQGEPARFCYNKEGRDLSEDSSWLAEAPARSPPPHAGASLRMEEWATSLEQAWRACCLNLDLNPASH